MGKIRGKLKYYVSVLMYSLFNTRKILRFYSSAKEILPNVDIPPDLPRISVIEAREKVDRGELVILDIRGARDFRKARIEGSINIEFSDILANLTQIPKAKEVGVMCYGGGASELVTLFLLKQDYPNVRNVDGGIVRWALEVDDSLWDRF